MKDVDTTRQLSPPSLKAFREFVRKIVAVPKAEIDKQETLYKRQRKAAKQRRAAR